MPPRRRNNVPSPSDGNGQTGLLLDDAGSLLTRLDVAKASFDHVEPFSLDLFRGFSSLRALTYSVSIPMITRLIQEIGFEELEVIYGHGGLINRTIEDVLSFQHVIDHEHNSALVSSLDDEKRQALFDSVAAGRTRLYVVKDAAIAHAKIYLLEDPDTDRRRVIVGSANLSEQALSGRQAETLLSFDDDEAAWNHYSAQYAAVRDTATSRLPVRTEQTPALDLAEIPTLKEALADERETGVTIYTPPAPAAEELAFPVVERKVERIKPAIRKTVTDLKPDRSGNVTFSRRIVRQMIRVSRARAEENGAQENTWLTINPDRTTVNLSNKLISLKPDWADVRSDAACWLEFFDNYSKGFAGDVPRLQRDYFTFMSWFYFSPLLCELRNAALAQDMFSFKHPMFAIVYGSSNCGKTSLIETLMTSMFEFPRIVETAQFTRSNLRGLQQSYRRFPIVFDDITRDRFNRNGEEIIKDDSIPDTEYPCFALSMNAEARNFKSEIVKRCLMIYTRTNLPGDRVVERNQLQRSVTGIRGRLSTSLYREYLRRSLVAIDALDRRMPATSTCLSFRRAFCAAFLTKRNLAEHPCPNGVSKPRWLNTSSGPLSVPNFSWKTSYPKNVSASAATRRNPAGHCARLRWWSTPAFRNCAASAPIFRTGSWTIPAALPVC